MAGGGDGHPRRLPAGDPHMSDAGRPAAPGRWRPLVAHSYRLGAAWAARGARGGGWPSGRAGVYRLLVPLEPWRYYELGRVASEPFAGDCLDVSSPKLLASLLQREGRGRWTAVDLLPDEVARWRDLDPALDLRVEDARALPFADGSFDAVACVSVIEHVEGDGDAAAMAEIWRVLRPGGVLHLTTNVAARAHDVLVDRPVYGGASAGGRPALLRAALLGGEPARAPPRVAVGGRGARSTWSSAARCTSASSRRGRPRFWPGASSRSCARGTSRRWRARPRCRRDGTGSPTCAFAGRDDGPPDRQDARPRSRNPQGWSRASDPGRTRPRDRRGAAARRRQYDRVVSAARRHGTAVTTRAWNALGTAEGSP